MQKKLFSTKYGKVLYKVTLALCVLVMVPLVTMACRRGLRVCFSKPCPPPPCVQQEPPKLKLEEPQAELLGMPREEDGGISLPGAYLSSLVSPYEDGLLFSSMGQFPLVTIPWEPLHPPFFGGGGGGWSSGDPWFPPPICHTPCDDHQHCPPTLPPPHITTPTPPNLVLASIGVVIVAGSHGYRRWRSARS